MTDFLVFLLIFTQAAINFVSVYSILKLKKSLSDSSENLQEEQEKIKRDIDSLKTTREMNNLLMTVQNSSFIAGVNNSMKSSFVALGSRINKLYRFLETNNLLTQDQKDEWEGKNETIVKVKTRESSENQSKD